MRKNEIITESADEINNFQFGNPYVSRLASRVQSRAQAEALTMLQLLLPGSNNFYYGEEIGMRDLPIGVSCAIIL